MNKLENKYYTLKELSPIVNLKYRQLQERILLVNEKYKGKNELIYKNNNKWFIHSSLISEFTRIRKPIDYKLFITIASKNNFDLEYWKYYISRLNKTLKKIDTSTRIKYVIEKTKNNIYHIHFITSFNKVKTLMNLIKKDDFSNNSNDMNTNIQNIYEVKGLHEYFRKQNKPVLLK